MHPRPPTRREVLGTGAALISGGLAGCGRGGGSTVTPTPTSPFVGTAFDGPDLVVSLRDDHDVSRLNLIGPEGSLYESASVAAGATTARLRLLDIQSASGFGHYTPGVQTLVAVGDDRTFEFALDLRPDLRIVEIEQYRGGNMGADLGKLAVSVENIGTGPTWVYDVTFRDAPNWAANNELVSDRGAPILFVPSEIEDTIIHPDSNRIFVGSSSPLLFTFDSPQSCNGTVEFTVVIGPAVGSPVVQPVQAMISGEASSAGLTNEYVCSDVDIIMLDGGTG